MRPTDLVPGNCYFSVGFWDREMLFPVVQTLRYVKCEDVPGEGRSWLFDDPALPASEQGEGPAFFSFPEEQLARVIEFDELISWLTDVSVDHPISPPIPAAHPGADLTDLEENLTRFTDPNERSKSLTITIRFTDLGFSLMRRQEGQIAIVLCAHARRQPEREAGIRSIFAEAGLTPDEDAVFNQGRQRALGYPVPADAPLLSSLCRRLLVGAYGIRPGDTLRYSWSEERHEG